MRISDTLKEKILPLRFEPLTSFDPENIPCHELSAPAVIELRPVVSVCMLAYNHAEYVGQAIDSVLAQETDFPFEIVIGEDNSTDNTRAIVMAYQAKYPDKIRMLYSDSNVGLNQNAMRVFKRCRGEFIASCECDDFWHRSDKLQLQYQYMLQHPECVCVYSDYNIYFQKQQETKEAILAARGITLEARNTMDDFLDGKRVHTITCSAFARKFEIDCSNHELLCLTTSMTDLIWWWEQVLRGYVAILPEALSTYRYNLPGRSATRQMHLHRILDFNLDSILISACYFEAMRPERVPGFLGMRLKQLLPEAIHGWNRQYRRIFLATLEWTCCELSFRENWQIFIWRHNWLCFPCLVGLKLKHKFRSWVSENLNQKQKNRLKLAKSNLEYYVSRVSGRIFGKK